MISRPPYYKGKNFCVNPVVKFGIPAYADSRRDKKVIGTPAYERYWEEQLYYCMNGYQTGGYFIPARFYYYMNFNSMSTINGIITPDMVDLHLELAYMIDYAKANGKNIIAAKGRRKGISEFTHKAVVDYGWRFKHAYKAGVAAGQDVYAQDFMSKWRAGDSLMVPEFSIKKLLNNDDEVIAGYEIQNDGGEYNEEGTKSTIYVRTFFKNPNLFKGLYLNDVIAEEAGEFEKLKEFYSATTDTLRDGDKQIGTMFIYGCVCAGTKVWDNNGNLINIEDLNPENGIIGFNQEKGEFSKETITYWQPPKEKPCYRITTATGRKLECSDDHPILFSRLGYVLGSRGKKKKGIKFVEAKDIKIGDQVMIIDQVPIFGNKKMWEPRLIGWLIGDGTYGIDHSPRMANCDSEINNHLLKNFDSKVTRSHITKDGRIYEEIRLKGICGELRELGIYGQTKTNKRLPKEIHSYRKKDICDLIGGIFDTDGYVYVSKKNSTHRIVLTSISFDLLYEILLLLQKFGIHCNITFVKPNIAPNRKDKNPYYVLGILDRESIIRFHENIKLSIKYKQDNLDKIYNYFKNKEVKLKRTFNGARPERVVNVEYIGYKPVYNLTAGTTNTYVANGIITHNTGGKIAKESKDFQDMYSRPDDFNCIKFTILGQRFYRPHYGGATRHGEDISDIPNLLAEGKKPFELIGVEDIKAAEDSIKRENERLLKSGDLKKYNEHRQNNPLKEEDIFLSTIVNEFDVNKLNEQLNIIDTNPKPYMRCALEWDKDNKGEIKYPLATVLVPLSNEDQRDDYVLIHIDHMTPNKQFSHLYCAGIDSYDQDTSKTSKSLGAMCVIIRRNTIQDALQLAPVAVIRCRPERKEKFYELCMKLSVHFNLIESVLIDVRCFLIGEYFKTRGCERFLAYRPTKFEKENSEQTNIYGISLNINSRPQMVSLMQTAIFDFYKNIWFRMLIEELLKFDEVAIGSDNDLADAYGIALMQDASMVISPRNQKDYNIEEIYALGDEFVTDKNGDLVPKNKNTYKSDEQDRPELWGLM